VLAAAIVTAAATAGLALLAYSQMRANEEQMRGVRAQSDAAIEIAKRQAAAAIEIARETREAAQRQWQPRVIAHGWGEPRPGSGDDAAPNEVAVGYRLKNEGTGPAFNVEHGVEVGGKLHTWGDRQYRAMTAGEELPPMLDSVGLPVRVNPIVVGVEKDEWGDPLVYLTRFENLLGERFEVRNFPDASTPSEFRRL
jgi:hypothetical protein